MATKTTAAVTDIGTLRHELYLLNMKKISGELKETHKIKVLKKQIARELTAMNNPTL
jgi:ribosomal protein L29